MGEVVGAVSYQAIAHKRGGTLYAYTKTGKLLTWENEEWEPIHSVRFREDKLKWEDMNFTGRVDHQRKRVSVMSNIPESALRSEEKFLERLMKRLYKKWPTYTFWFWSCDCSSGKQVT